MWFSENSHPYEKVSFLGMRDEHVTPVQAEITQMASDDFDLGELI